MIPAVVNYNLFVIVAVLACAYLILCNRVRIVARDMGLPPAKWFFISIVFTPIPAAIVFWRHNLLGLRDRQRGRFRRFFKSSGQSPRNDEPDKNPPRRCPHCGGMIGLDELRRADGVSACPHCGLTIEKDDIA